MNFFQICLCLVVSTCLFDVACSQSPLVEIRDPNELTVKYEFVGKVGETKKYYIGLKDIPKAPPLPTGYEFLNKAYYVKTEVVPFGSPTITFKVAVDNPKDFAKVRIMHLVENEREPIGYQWGDCTVTAQWWAERLKNRELTDVERRTADEQIAKEVPDYSQRLVRCSPWSRRSEDYFAIVLAPDKFPDQSSTRLKISLESSKPSSKKGEVIYVIALRNEGDKDIAEVNFHSTFDDDSNLLSVTSSQGACKRAKWGSKWGSSVCHLGILRAGNVATVEFRGEPSGGVGSIGPHRQNQNWIIDGGFKERPEDPYWTPNTFSFQPISPLTVRPGE